jgi:hypothetical protein
MKQVLVRLAMVLVMCGAQSMPLTEARAGTIVTGGGGGSGGGGDSCSACQQYWVAQGATSLADPGCTFHVVPVQGNTILAALDNMYTYQSGSTPACASVSQVKAQLKQICALYNRTCVAIGGPISADGACFSELGGALHGQTVGGDEMQVYCGTYAP